MHQCFSRGQERGFLLETQLGNTKWKGIYVLINSDCTGFGDTPLLLLSDVLTLLVLHPLLNLRSRRIFSHAAKIIWTFSNTFLVLLHIFQPILQSSMNYQVFSLRLVRQVC